MYKTKATYHEDAKLFYSVLNCYKLPYTRVQKEKVLSNNACIAVPNDVRSSLNSERKLFLFYYGMLIRSLEQARTTPIKTVWRADLRIEVTGAKFCSRNGKSRLKKRYRWLEGK